MSLSSQDRAEVRRLVNQLQRARAAQGLSQAEVAERMGVTQATVSEFESFTSDPHLWTVQRYARAIDATITFSLS